MTENPNRSYYNKGTFFLITQPHTQFNFEQFAFSVEHIKWLFLPEKKINSMLNARLKLSVLVNFNRSLKKQTDRREYNPKRKNSFGKNKELHMTPPPIPTAAASPSPTTLTSTASNSSFASGPGPALPSMRQTKEHIPVNNFNAQEVTTYLSNSWKEAIDRLHDNNIPEAVHITTLSIFSKKFTLGISKEKPELYRPPEVWGRPGGPAWGSRGHMANGNDFFTELRKASQVTNSQSAGTAKDAPNKVLVDRVMDKWVSWTKSPFNHFHEENH
ncbi:hypothetical protein G9A89_013719 [Geosiphon pyriformis]|nr:hypothetical protein G9A89_013719 [Geosiphon pyriformis]